MSADRHAAWAAELLDLQRRADALGAEAETTVGRTKWYCLHGVSASIERARREGEQLFAEEHPDGYDASPYFPESLGWRRDDGGRAEARGFGGTKGARDCVVRAIAIATQLPYATVYRALARRQEDYAAGLDPAEAHARHGRWRPRRPNQGVAPAVSTDYLTALGWVEHSVTFAHCFPERPLSDVLPKVGRVIVFTPRHAFAVVAGVVHDLFPQLGAWAYVESYWTEPVRYLRRRSRP